MAKGARSVIGGVTMALCLARPAAAESPTVALRVDNVAGVTRSSLKAAQDTAARIYEAIGVRLVWLEDGVTPPPAPVMRLSVVLVAPTAERFFLAKMPGPLGALGAAPLNSRRIYIFCRRINQFTRSTGGVFDTILGRVFAHEVGHHVLPAQGHAEHGIMRETIDDKSLGAAPGFTAGQADAIRSLLTKIPKQAT